MTYTPYDSLLAQFHLKVVCFTCCAYRTGTWSCVRQTICYLRGGRGWLGKTLNCHRPSNACESEGPHPVKPFVSRRISELGWTSLQFFWDCCYSPPPSPFTSVISVSMELVRPGNRNIFRLENYSDYSKSELLWRGGFYLWIKVREINYVCLVEFPRMHRFHIIIMPNILESSFNYTSDFQYPFWEFSAILTVILNVVFRL